MLKLTELQVSSRNHPIGLDEQPVFSWKMVSDIPDTIQTAYRVRVGSWDTGHVESGDSLFVPYAGPAYAACHGGQRVVQGGLGICSQPQPLRRPGGTAGDAMPGRPNCRHRRGLAGYHRPGATCRILLWRGL